MLVLLKNHLNYLKDFKLLKKYKNFYFLRTHFFNNIQ